ncbi:hypothetical protein B0H17DRAFT_1106908 [Mycena rosella]|uniref:Uncharacterized protein n=1 Tax=Mycena rosella TaxID=1033263 RepID=A0AAD7C2T3_MYCRO|nr:hypothetical protein B0H17DRAFT_1106908 [Mycena rosella]
MQKGEDRNFFRFATALTILVGSSISIQSTDPPQGLEKAEKLLRDYLLGFSEVVAPIWPEEMKPDHHWAVHIPDRVPDYGPLYSFWALLTERKRNNWTGGLLKVSMMREFHRTAQLDEVNKDALGTIEDAAAHERESTRVLAGSIAARAERIQDDGCAWASSAGSSIIQFQFNGEPYAGEIRVIFRHKQTGPELSVDTWLYNTYAQANDTTVPLVCSHWLIFSAKLHAVKLDTRTRPCGLRRQWIGCVPVRFWLMEWATAPEEEE